MRVHEEFRQCNGCGMSGRGPNAPPLVQVKVFFPDATAVVSSKHMAGMSVLQSMPLVDAELGPTSDGCFVFELCESCIVDKPILSACVWKP